MEAEATPTTGADAGAGTGGGLDVTESFFSGASPENVAHQVNEPAAPTTETPTPTMEPAPQQAAKEEPASAETKPEEAADQTAEQFAEPLPQKIEDLLKAVKQANPKLGTELNRIVREEHFLLHGPTGFLSTFPGGVAEAQEYKILAPTVEDLREKAEFSERYWKLEQGHASNPPAVVEAIIGDEGVPEDSRRASAFAAALEPTLRQRYPHRYGEFAKPFNENYARNIDKNVRAMGTPEEQELWANMVQKFGISFGNGNGRPQAAPPPELRELQTLRDTLASQQGERRNLFFQDVNREVTPTLRGEIRKNLEEKVGSGLPQDVRGELLDEMADGISRSVWKELNENPVIASDLARMIEGGDFSLNHRQQVVDRVLTRAKAFIATKSAPEITRTMNRIRKLTGGNTNASKPTAQTAASKDVGSGAGAGSVPTGSPKGFPPGWNAMNVNQRAAALAPLVNWQAMGEDAEITFNAVCAGYDEPSKVVLKAR